MLQQKVKVLDKYRELIINAQNYIWQHAETGYREKQTSKYLEDAFEDLGYDLIRADNIPGFYTVLDTGRPGPEVLVLGELDALICSEHPDANPETGAVHCCGHSAQCAALLGLAASLKEPDVLDGLSGRIRLCAVPAEELIEIEYRSQLKKEGKIKYMGGKTEFLYRGYFDGVDIAFMVHTSGGEKFAVRQGSIGCMAKRVIYKGVSSHAGGSPWNGCNALYAATLGISAINSIRETFKEPDVIRVHPIITKGGGAVNAIPDEVIIESYVRGSNFEAIAQANERVNRALCGAALSLGANIDIQDTPGYAPLLNSNDMIQLSVDAVEQAMPEMSISVSDKMGAGSTDMGDLSGIMPVVHPYAPGAVGKAHGSDYYVENSDLACVASAKFQLGMLILLLKDDAARAKQIVADFEPTFASKEEYFNFIDSISSEGDRITYNENRTAEVRL